MDSKLQRKALSGLAFMPLILSLAVFIPAGSLAYWQGWLCIVVFTAATFISTLTLIKNDPALLERRMRSGPTAEKRGAQKIIMWFITVLFFAPLIIGGLDYRFGWSHLPMAVPAIGAVLIMLSYVVFHLVFRENTFASATIEIAEGHKVIATGPYHFVRHPMYSGALVLLLGIPLALGSLWSLLSVFPMLPILMWRIVDEENLLQKQLTGYNDYCKQVTYRLIPWLY